MVEDRRVSYRVCSVGVAVAAFALLAGCGSDSSAPATVLIDVPETVALGELPEPLSGADTPPDPPTTPPTSAAPPTSSTLPLDDLLDGPVGDYTFGSRVLMIGDSILASTAPRFGGAMCEVLIDFGWRVELDAEPGRFVEFGDRVLDERLQPESGLDWDAAAVFLGNNFDGDFESFTQELDEILERLAPRPVVLYTLTEFDPDRAALNDIIRAQKRLHPNIVIVDWAGVTEAEPDTLLISDGLHLTPAGSRRLVVHTAGALGVAPGGPPGECLPSPFQNDLTTD